MNSIKLFACLLLVLCAGVCGCNQEVPISQMRTNTLTLSPDALLADEKGRLWLSTEAVGKPYSDDGLFVTRSRQGEYAVSVCYLERDGKLRGWDLTPRVYDGKAALDSVTYFGGTESGAEKWHDMNGHLLLPPELESQASRKKRSANAKRLVEVGVGECCWTKPDALYADGQGHVFLHGGVMVYDRPEGKGEIQLMRTEHGYAVDLDKAPGARWTPGVHGKAGEPQVVTELRGQDLVLNRTTTGQILLPKRLQP
ncbi:MAG: hypothetical protein K2W82_15740 [Candidatus Obscuribacterales bacterium]|nr:hypothetical protein [Candidatus Obscuribacterales bacterium]